MEDYSDKTLRALIRHLIMEDVPNLAIDPQANPDRRALITAQAALLLRKVFSGKGLVALATMGLIFEPEFTKDLLVYGVDKFENVVEAVEVFNKTGGSVFEKLAEASAKYGTQERAAKYRYLQKLKETAEGTNSLTAEIVKNLATDYNKYKPGQPVDANDVTNEDIKIYNAIVSGDVSGTFDSGSFETFSEMPTLRIKDFDNHDGDYSPSIETEYKNKIEDERKAGNYINANIMEALRQAHDFTTQGKTEQATEKFNMAIDIYNLAMDGNLDDVEKIVMFERIEDLERNFAHGFLSSMQKAAAEKADDVFTDTVNKATEIVTSKLGINLPKK